MQGKKQDIKNKILKFLRDLAYVETWIVHGDKEYKIPNCIRMEAAKLLIDIDQIGKKEIL
jgi:hypothetical protein